MDKLTAITDPEIRHLLSAARMVLDRVAEGHDERQGAAKVAQRIVDVIGHSVTDEQPARTISIPAEWYWGAHGSAVPRFDYLHLRLNTDGSVTWFSDAPDSGSYGKDKN